MIAAILLAAIVTTATPPESPPAQPPPSHSAGLALPSVDAGLALPYPAYGTPQPQITRTRRQSDIPTLVTLDQAIAIAIDRIPSLAAARA